MTISSKGNLLFLVVSFCGATLVSSKALWDPNIRYYNYNEIDADNIPDDLDPDSFRLEPTLDDDDDDDDDVDVAEDEEFDDGSDEGESDEDADDDGSEEDENDGNDDSDEDDDDSSERRKKRELFSPYGDDKDTENEIVDEGLEYEDEDKKLKEDFDEEEKFGSKENERETEEEIEEEEEEEKRAEEEEEEERAAVEEEKTAEEGENEEKMAEEEEEEEKVTEEEEEKEQGAGEEIKKDKTIVGTGVEKKPEPGIKFPDIMEFDDDFLDEKGIKKHFVPVKGFFSKMWDKMKRFPKKIHSYFHGHY